MTLYLAFTPQPTPAWLLFHRTTQNAWADPPAHSGLAKGELWVQILINIPALPPSQWTHSLVSSLSPTSLLPSLPMVYLTSFLGRPWASWTQLVQTGTLLFPTRISPSFWLFLNKCYLLFLSHYMALQSNWSFTPEIHRHFSASPSVNLSQNLIGLTIKIYPQFSPLFSPICIGISSTQPPSLTRTTAMVFQMTSLLILLSPSIHRIHNLDHFVIGCLKPFKVYLCMQMKWALSYPSNPAMFPAESVLSTQHCQVRGSFLLRNHPIVWTVAMAWTTPLHPIWAGWKWDLLPFSKPFP